MRMGQGVRTGLGHGGITCVLQTQVSVVVFSFFFFLFFLLTGFSISNKTASKSLKFSARGA